MTRTCQAKVAAESRFPSKEFDALHSCNACQQRRGRENDLGSQKTIATVIP
jgi:hypothetical protein